MTSDMAGLAALLKAVAKTLLVVLPVEAMYRVVRRRRLNDRLVREYSLARMVEFNLFGIFVVVACCRLFGMLCETELTFFSE